MYSKFITYLGCCCQTRAGIELPEQERNRAMSKHSVCREARVQSLFQLLLGDLRASGCGFPDGYGKEGGEGIKCSVSRPRGQGDFPEDAIEKAEPLQEIEWVPFATKEGQYLEQIFALSLAISEYPARRPVDQGIYQVENSEAGFCELLGKVVRLHRTNGGQYMCCRRLVKTVHVYQIQESLCGGRQA